MDTVRVLRIVEYVGPRDAVEEQIRLSLHGEREGVMSKATGHRCVIRAGTIGEFPEILKNTPMCRDHPDRPAITNLDGEDLCKECADAWARGEGDHARSLDDEIPF